jgi:NitT/TauT family transport system substrate-binding protein
MSTSAIHRFGRRQFLSSTSVLGAASLLGVPGRADAEPPPEVKKIRIAEALVACQAPPHVAEELLLAEGFSEVEYIPGR